MKALLTAAMLFFLYAQSFGQSWTELNDSLLYYSGKGDFKRSIIAGEKAVQIAKEEFGVKDSNYATSLDNLGLSYKRMGQFEKAEPLYIQAKDIRKEVLGENHPHYTTSLNNLGALYKSKGQFEKAEPLYVQAVEIRKTLFGIKHFSYATSLNNLASLYESMGQYEKAEPLYIQAKDIRKEVLGESHPDYAGVVNNLGGLYFRMGQYSKTEELYTLARDIRKKVLGENHPDYATSLNNLAAFYYYTGKYDKAVSLFIQGIEIYKNILGEKHPDYGLSLNNLAYLYTTLGEYAKAEPLYQQAIEIRKKALGENHPEYGSSLSNLGIVYEQLGEYSKAESLYLKAKEILKKALGEDHRDYAVNLNNLASLYESLGQYSKAESYYVQVNAALLKKLGENHADYATGLGNLAKMYLNMGEYAKAEPLYIKATEIKKKALGDTHIDYAVNLGSLASLYTRMGEYSKAEPLHTKTLEIYKKAVGENHPDYASVLHNSAAFNEKKGDYSKAEAFYVQSINIRKKAVGENHPDYAAGLRDLADMYAKTGQFAKAEPLFIQSSKIIKQNIRNSFSILSEQEKYNFIANKISLGEDENSILFNHRDVTAATVYNLADNLIFLKGLVLDDSRTVLSLLQQNNNHELRKLYEQWHEKKKVLAKQYSLPVSGRRNDLRDVETESEELEKELNRRSAVFRSLQEASCISLTDIYKKIGNEEAAVEFISFRLHTNKRTDSTIYAAYVLTKKDSVPRFVPLFEERQLQQLLDDTRKITRTPAKAFYGDQPTEKYKNTKQGESLYKLVWQPLEPYLKNIKRISYSPAGKLYSIAFHALPAGNDSLLMEKYQLQQYTSTRQAALRDEENQTTKPAGITLFGNASFSMDSMQLIKLRTGIDGGYVSRSIYSPSLRGEGFEPWGSLPGTAQEVNSIRRLFDDNKITTRLFAETTASEENLKALSGNSPQVLHIATHGFFLPEPVKAKDKGVRQTNAYTLADDPLLRTGLILAGGNYAWSGKIPVDGVEDGVVTAYEIAQLNLSNTELVVLSACETALGDVKGSEGVFGLQRAFKMAGVKKMLVSLWKVPDKETAELMTSFYTYWMAGKTINNAFAQAQADMRKKYSPFYWAAFVLVE